MILVTGANGTTGRATLQALTDMGVPVRALIRDRSKLPAIDGVDIAIGDFRDSASLDAALHGIESAYLVCATSPRQVEFESAFVAAAQRAGVQHIVRLSVIGVDRPGIDRIRFAAQHQAAENLVREAGIPWTFLRPTSFMQNYLNHAATIASEGVFYSPLSPAARIPQVDADDIGAMAAATLTGSGHEGQAYVLTGPEALSDDDVADRLSRGLGRDVKHIQVPVQTARDGMVAAGVPEWNVDGLVELFTIYESGRAATIAPDIERILGRAARTIDDFIAAHRSAFAGEPATTRP